MNKPNVGKSRLTKEKIQPLMARLLELLREILVSVHEERLMLDRDVIQPLGEILDRRQTLFEAFEVCYRQFADFVDLFSTHAPKVQTLAECLERLQNHLEAEDMELLLLIEQLSCISKEMQGETSSLVHLLERKSSSLATHGLVLQKIAPQPVRVAIGLAEPDEEEAEQL